MALIASSQCILQQCIKLALADWFDSWIDLTNTCAGRYGVVYPSILQRNSFSSTRTHSSYVRVLSNQSSVFPCLETEYVCILVNAESSGKYLTLDVFHVVSIFSLFLLHFDFDDIMLNTATYLAWAQLMDFTR